MDQVWDNWYFEPNRHLIVAEGVDPKYHKPSRRSSLVITAIS